MTFVLMRTATSRRRRRWCGRSSTSAVGADGLEFGAGPHRPPRRRRQRGGRARCCTCTSQDGDRRRGRPGVLAGRGRTGARLLPRLHAHRRRPATATPYGVFSADYVPPETVPHVAVLARRRRDIDVTADPRPTGADSRRRGRAADRTEPYRSAARRAAPGGVPLGDAGRGPLRRQGRQRQPRRLGPRPTPATPGCATPHRRPAARAAARGGRPAGRPARAAEPARRQLRHRGPARRGRGRLHPLRPAGQGPRRVAALPPRRHPRRRCSPRRCA